MAKRKPTVEETFRWLAGNSYLEVNVVGQNEKEFRRRYRKIKGRLPKRGVQYNVAKDSKIKGGDEFRLVIPKKDECYKRVLEDGFGLKPLRTTPNGQGWRKGDKEFAYFLLKIGFDIGHPSKGRTLHSRTGVAGTAKKAANAAIKDREFLDGLRREIMREFTVRNQAVVRLAKMSQPCVCQVCDFDFGEKYGLLGRDFIEGHHKDPVASYGKKGKSVKVSDIVLVCSNCHRMLHKGTGIKDWRKLRKLVRRLAARRRET